MTHKDELILDLWRELLRLGHELPTELQTRVEWAHERMLDKEDKRRIKAIADPVRREQELLAFKRNYHGADTGRWQVKGNGND